METKENTPVHLMVNHYKSLGIEIDQSILDLLLQLQNRFFKEWYQKGVIDGVQKAKDSITKDKEVGMMFRDIIMNNPYKK